MTCSCVLSSVIKKRGNICPLLPVNFCQAQRSSGQRMVGTHRLTRPKAQELMPGRRHALASARCCPLSISGASQLMFHLRANHVLGTARKQEEQTISNQQLETAELLFYFRRDSDGNVRVWLWGIRLGVLVLIFSWVDCL